MNEEKGADTEKTRDQALDKLILEDIDFKEEDVTLLGDFRVLLDRESHPRDFYFIVGSLHLLLILHLKGLEFAHIVGSALLVWIGFRYLYIRMAGVLSISNNEHFSYRNRTVLASSYAELRGYVEILATLLLDVVKWKDAGDSIKALSVCALAAVVFHFVDFFFIVYMASMFVIFKLNSK